MLLGNKCDMDDKRVVPKGKGEQVKVSKGSRCSLLFIVLHMVVYTEVVMECAELFRSLQDAIVIRA